MKPKSSSKNNSTAVYMRPNDIIFIVLDTQRVDRLGCYGYSNENQDGFITPHLDAFTKEGALFEMAISPAQWTIPSHASMFTGLYPSAHQVTQSNQSLGTDRKHVAELLQSKGYETVGFCNNPLVGIINNGFKRGFNRFYNYGGAFPSVPKDATLLPWPVNQLLELYTQFLRRISYPIQNFFGRSDLAFRISLNAFLTPIWSKIANFKGQNARSVDDLIYWLQERENRKEQEEQKPLFLFVNLMETHLPFWPPGEFVDQTAPYMRKDKEARGIMRRWNKEAYRWAAPLAEPLGELEGRVLSDMYDAEVTYQDDYLGPLFSFLSQRRNAQETLTIIVSDHGDGLGEHSYFGHAFVAYQELIHVPLIMHWPKGITPDTRVQTPVSTRRIYHTILDAAGVKNDDQLVSGEEAAAKLSLMKSIRGADPEEGQVFAEVYPPMNFAKAVKHRQPELLDRFRCMEIRKALVKDRMKLIQISDEVDELFNLDLDPLEIENLVEALPEAVVELDKEIAAWSSIIHAQSEDIGAGATLDLESDELLADRLRGLGYIE